MKIERYVMGMFQTNTYLLINEDECLLIDPASKADKLIDIIGNRKLVGILLTHGHLDHIKAVDGLVQQYKCPTYIQEADIELAKDKNQGRKFGLTTSAYISSKLIPIKEGNNQISSFVFETIYTPGHTKGSVCYRFKKELFTGDTLFHLSAGRTDLDSGSETDLRASLKVIKNINEDLNIYPGHEDLSTLEYEKIYNPYLN